MNFALLDYEKIEKLLIIIKDSKSKETSDLLAAPAKAMLMVLVCKMMMYCSLLTFEKHP